MLVNTMRFGEFDFTVATSTFCYVSESASGAGWDFEFQAVCEGEKCAQMFPFGAILRCEAAPLPLENRYDLSGAQVYLEQPYDEESGEPFFGFLVAEEHEVLQMQLTFLQREETRYLIDIEADIAPSVLGHVAPLRLLAWAEQLPPRTYPA